MGKTSFKGPVYGSKSVLWSHFIPVTSSGGSTAIAAVNSLRVVPAYEDWYVCELQASCSTCTSNAAAIYLKTEGGLTTIPARLDAPGNGSTRAATLTSFTSGTSTTFSTQVVITASAGEYEGSFVPAGSTLRLVSSGDSGIANLNINVIGYRRWINSTRSEL